MELSVELAMGVHRECACRLGEVFVRYIEDIWKDLLVFVAKEITACNAKGIKHKKVHVLICHCMRALDMFSLRI